MLAKPEVEVLDQFKQAVIYLCQKGVTVYVDEFAHKYLSQECSYEFDSFLECLRNDNTQSSTATKATVSLRQQQANPYFNASVFSSSSNSTSTIGKIKQIDNPSLHLIDFIITFGGDGLLMHCNTLFESSHPYSSLPISIPPTMSFDFGSLGFLAPFQFEYFEREVWRNNLCINLAEKCWQCINSIDHIDPNEVVLYN